MRRCRGRRKQRLQLPPPDVKLITAQIPITRTKQIEEHHRCRNLLRQKASPAKPQDESAAAKPQSPVRHPWRSQSPHPARTASATAPAAVRSIPENTVFSDFSSRLCSKTSSPSRKSKHETHPTSVRKSTHRSVAILQSASESMGKTGGFTGKFMIQCYTDRHFLPENPIRRNGSYQGAPSGAVFDYSIPVGPLCCTKFLEQRKKTGAPS